MGLVFEEGPAVYKGEQSVKPASSVRHLKQLTRKNREFLASIGVTFHNSDAGSR